VPDGGARCTASGYDQLAHLGEQSTWRYSASGTGGRNNEERVAAARCGQGPRRRASTWCWWDTPAACRIDLRDDGGDGADPALPAQPMNRLLVVRFDDRPGRRAELHPRLSRPVGAHRRGWLTKLGRRQLRCPFRSARCSRCHRISVHRTGRGRWRPCSPSTRKRMASRILRYGGIVLTLVRSQARSGTEGMWRSIAGRKLQKPPSDFSDFVQQHADDQKRMGSRGA